MPENATPDASTSSVRIGLHAYPQIWVDDKLVDFPLKRGWALIALLSEHGGKMSRQHAARLLWPDAEVGIGRARLRRLVHQLNRGAGVELIAGDVDAVCLSRDGGDIEIDLVQTRRAAHAVLDGHFDDAHVECLLQPASRHILAGFVLDADTVQAWLEDQRLTHERLLVRALQRLAEQRLASHRPQDAALAARRLLDIDAFADAGHALLIEALAQLGQAAAVDVAYDEFATMLRHEFGTRPSALIEATYARAGALLQQRGDAPPAQPVTDTPRPRIHYTLSHDGVRLAYAHSGRGPPLVKAATWLSHLEFDWVSPVWAHLLSAMARDFTYVRYDERGCGLSDWNVDGLSFDSWVRDLESVIDALGVPQVALLGMSQGASIAIAYAVRHPERVTHLVLHGGYARGRLKRSATPAQREEAETMARLAELGWGKADPSFRQFFTSQFIPGGTREQHQWFNELERISTSPRNAARFMRAFATIDVSALLSQVRCPTLILHSRDDVRVPFDESRLMADTIPGARLVPIDSGNHLLLADEPGWADWLREVRAFLGVTTAPPDAAETFSARGRPSAP
jgi:pimeloyl-ACP methyl ester carboxylesterase/DNA-binding SARP family transcriptional activator